MKYTTEILVAEDRYVCLQLPSYVPEGRAIVTVRFEILDDLDDRSEPFARLGREDEDVEWWDRSDDSNAPGVADDQIEGVSPPNLRT